MKRKRKAAASDDDDDTDIDVNFIDNMEGEGDDGVSGLSIDENEVKVMPMPELGSIAALREKLHARMAALRRSGSKDGGNVEAGDRDELLEERRRQRAAMREKRRKETKEKIRLEEEAKGKKGKRKDSRIQGHQTKVF